MKRFDGKGTELEPLSGLDGDQLGRLVQSVFLQPGGDQAECQTAAINGDRNLANDISHPSGMVLVTMGQQNGLQMLLIFLQEGNVRDDHFHSQVASRTAARKGDAGVNENHVTAVTQGRAVHPKFAHSSKRRNFQILTHKRGEL